jgi:hypothetical protein
MTKKYEMIQLELRVIEENLNEMYRNQIPKIKRYRDDDRVKKYLWMESEVKGLSRIGITHAGMCWEFTLYRKRRAGEYNPFRCVREEQREARSATSSSSCSGVKKSCMMDKVNLKESENLNVKKRSGTRNGNQKKSRARMRQHPMNSKQPFFRTQNVDREKGVHVRPTLGPHPAQ